jgi:RNA polymerase sigma factor (TIGR02999 family)
MARQEGVTEAIRRLQRGEEGALDRLVPLIYEELRVLARRHAGVQPKGATLDTTGLVHELYLQLAGRRPSPWRDRGHFFAAAARAMRHIVIDHARGRRRQKRGGGQLHVALDEMQLPVREEAARLIAVDESLTRLAREDERLARVVECRFFAGLSDAETAEALGVSARTVQRAWGEARSWLKKDMSSQSRSVS